MSTVSNEQFLFCCIENSHGGTIDWQTVADKCGIVSKGAANVKYSRMKAKFGIVGAANGGDDKTPKKATPRKSTGKKAAEEKATPTSKKRKVQEVDNEEEVKYNVKGEEQDAGAAS